MFVGGSGERRKKRRDEATRESLVMLRILLLMELGMSASKIYNITKFRFSCNAKKKNVLKFFFC